MTSDLTNGAVGGHSGGVEVAKYVELRVGWEVRKWRLKFGEKGKKALWENQRVPHACHNQLA